MARPLRIQYPGALYHITARGNRKEEIFLGSPDLYQFLQILEKVVKKYSWVCHAYCLMKNHYHLLVETPIGNLSQGMSQLNGTYTQYFNRSHDNVGHLFQGRFKSIVVEKESYLLELCRYVVCNPVRAGLCSKPKDWKWSSYNATAYGKNVPDFLEVDWLLKQFSDDVASARNQYMEFVEAGLAMNKSPLDKTVNQVACGSETFVNNIQRTLSFDRETDDLPGGKLPFGRPSLGVLVSAKGQSGKHQRNEEVCRAYFEYGYNLKEIAAHLGVHYATVSRIVAKKREMLHNGA